MYIYIYRCICKYVYRATTVHVDIDILPKIGDVGIAFQGVAENYVMV